MTALTARLDRFTSTRLFAAVAAPLFAIYLVTANWSMPYNIDALTNVLTAWELGTNGDVFLEDHRALATPEYTGSIAWVVPAQDSVAAQYPPGTAALAAPLYAIWPGEADTALVFAGKSDAPPVEIPVPPFGPAAIVSAAVVAAAAGFLALTFRRFVDPTTALAGAYVAGVATGAWSVASNALWQHGPGMLWLTLGTFLSATYRVGAGLAFGAAILTRPPTALVAAANGLWQSLRERSPGPALKIGVASAIGLVGVLLYNDAVFGGASVSGGYGSSFTERAVSFELLDYLGNIALALVHPQRGLLVFSPFLVLLLPGIPRGWRAAPAWVRGSAVGGLLYLLLQLKANRYSGGEGFWGYRYPLETLAAGAPLLLLAYREWLQSQSDLMRKTFRILLALSIAMTALGAFYF